MCVCVCACVFVYVLVSGCVIESSCFRVRVYNCAFRCVWACVKVRLRGRPIVSQPMSLCVCFFECVAV